MNKRCSHAGPVAVMCCCYEHWAAIVTRVIICLVFPDSAHPGPKPSPRIQKEAGMDVGRPLSEPSGAGQEPFYISTSVSTAVKWGTVRIPAS
jgi:hypothetical protein